MSKLQEEVKKRFVVSRSRQHSRCEDRPAVPSTVLAPIEQSGDALRGRQRDQERRACRRHRRRPCWRRQCSWLGPRQMASQKSQGQCQQGQLGWCRWRMGKEQRLGRCWTGLGRLEQREQSWCRLERLGWMRPGRSRLAQMGQQR